jgi:hypothetical protein
MSPTGVLAHRKLVLTAKRDDEIVLPTSLATSPLTLRQIGAVMMLSCITAPGFDYEAVFAKGGEEFVEVMQELKKLGVLKAKFTKPNYLALEIDLKAVGC